MTLVEAGEIAIKAVNEALREDLEWTYGHDISTSQDERRDILRRLVATGLWRPDPNPIFSEDIIYPVWPK